jgi:glycosyltransferase involved in cell wall biosynthesis
LLLSNLYPPHVEGGAEILARDVAGGLERLGHEVLILTSSFGLDKLEQDGPVWRTLRLAPPAHFDRKRSLLRQLDQPVNYYRRYHRPANADELRRVVALTQPDVLYIWEIAGLGVNSLLQALPALNVPIVFQLGSYLLIYARSPDTEQSHLRMRWLKQRLIGTVPTLAWTSLIAVSDAVKQQYVEAGFDPNRIEVIYNGVDQRFLNMPPANDRGSANECVSLLFVGRLRDEKGILIILKALDRLLHGQGEEESRKPLWHLNIVGSGDKTYISELETFLRERCLEDCVTFLGKITQDELIRYYDCSDILLVPSLWQEPFGLVIAEAMARSLPVIASNIGGPAEILTHDVNGLLVEPGDERALASAILQLSQDTQKRTRLAQAARMTVRERFTIEENARQVEQHLLRAIQYYKEFGN